jgi:hypothetical protein
MKRERGGRGERKEGRKEEGRKRKTGGREGGRGRCVCVYYCREGDGGGHVLRETTGRGLCGLVCPSRTSERGGEGDCVKEGGGEEGEEEGERERGCAPVVMEREKKR